MNRLERRVVAIGISDARNGACAPRSTRLQRWLRLLTGRTVAPSMANPRLEALRQFVCAVTRRPDQLGAAAAALAASSFSADEIAEVTRMMGFGEAWPLAA